MVINTNVTALVAQRNLGTSSDKLSNSLSRLATGNKIIQPQDDAAGLAMYSRLDARISRIGATRVALANTLSFLQTADGYLSKVQGALDRMSELASLAIDPTKSTTDKELYDSEFTDLADFINTISSKTFNGVGLFGNGAASIKVAGDEDGTASQQIEIKLPDVANAHMANATLKGSLPSTGAVAAIENVKKGLDQVTEERAKIGGYMSRVNTSLDTLAVLKENMAAASSRIRDVDVAEESAVYSRYSILVQAGTAMLAQANILPQTALRLLT